MNQFEFFRDPAYKHPRARCTFCGSTSNHLLPSLQNHLAKCSEFLANMTRPPPCSVPCMYFHALIYRNKFDKHVAACRVNPHSCWRCGILVPPSDSDTHNEHCKSRVWKCRACRRQNIPLRDRQNHLENCLYYVCSSCGKKTLRVDREKHSQDCEYR